MLACVLADHILRDRAQNVRSLTNMAPSVGLTRT